MASSFPRFAALAAPLAVVAGLLACSGDDSTPGTAGPAPPGDASQPAIPKIEAGAPCATDNDCQPGLSCLYPVSNCQAFRVCTATPPATCPSPQTMCSCLAEPVVTCNGYSSDPVDTTVTTCGGDGGVVIVPTDAGNDTGAVVDAGVDSGGPDASDAASE
jgi:hypothetical protein